MDSVENSINIIVNQKLVGNCLFIVCHETFQTMRY